LSASSPGKTPSRAPQRFSFRRLTAGEIESCAGELAALDAAVGAGATDADFRRWLHADPARQGSCCIVALREDRIVGQIGLTILPFQCGGEDLKAALVGRFRVLDDARSWSCFRGLLGTCTEVAQEAGAAFSYGFQVPAAADATELVGARTLCRLPVLGAFVSLPKLLMGRGLPRPLAALGRVAQPILGPARPPDPPEGVRLGLLSGPQALPARFPWEDAPGDPISVVRDRAYLEWRYGRCPNRAYGLVGAWQGKELGGLAVYRTVPEGARAYLLELMARDNDGPLLDALVGDALRRAKADGAGLVSASFPEGSSQYGALRRLGFATWTTRLWRVSLSVTPYRADLRDLLLRPANWHLNLGDWLSF
jgi:hypothetical protein